jgi:hypothetical protein
MINLRQCLLSAIVLTFSALPAAAAERMPAKLVGNWCMVNPVQDGKSTYNRAPRCSHGSFMRFRPDGLDGQDGLDGPSAKCKLLQVMVTNKPDDYLVKFRCSGEGQSWSMIYRLSLQEKQLIVTDID